MTIYYVVYTAQQRQGGYKWQQPVNVYVLYGPADELKRIKTRNSVGSQHCPNVREHYIDWGDGRYGGPRSRLGRAIESAHKWAGEQGYRHKVS